MIERSFSSIEPLSVNVVLCGLQQIRVGLTLHGWGEGGYHSMGNAYRGLKRYPEAIAAYKEAIAIKSDDAVA